MLNFVNGEMKKKLLILLLISIQLLVEFYSMQAQEKLLPASLDSGLVAYYPFDGDADDHSGNRNHGIVHGTRLTSDRFGNPRSAYLFERVDDNIRISKSSDFDFSDEQAMSLGFWIQELADDGQANIEIRFSIGGPTCLYFAFNTSITMKRLLTLVHASECAVSVKKLITDSMKNWHHVFSTMNNNFLSLYLNGVMVDRRSLYDTKWNSLYTSGILITPNDANHIRAKTAIDDLRIYNRTLSADEIAMLYNLGKENK